MFSYSTFHTLIDTAASVGRRRHPLASAGRRWHGLVERKRAQILASRHPCLVYNHSEETD